MNGHKACPEAVEGVSGTGVDHAQFVKLYGSAPDKAKDCYLPAERTAIPTADHWRTRQKHIVNIIYRHINTTTGPGYA